MTDAAATTKPTLNTLHALRAIAALCVAALHMYYRENLTADGVLPSMMELTRVGTDLFFVVSGAVLAFSTAKRSHRVDEAASFLYDRVTRIMPLYWCVTLLVLAIWILSGQRFLANLVHQPEFWSTAFLLPTGVKPALPVAWSLTNLVFFYLIFSLTIFFPRKFEAAILILWVGIVLALRLSGGEHSVSPVVQLIAHISALEFISGIVIMRLALAGRRLSSSLLLGAAIVWFGIVALAAGPNPNIKTFMNGDFRVLTLGVAAVILAAAAISFDLAKPRKPTKILRLLGDASFGIYLGHSLCVGLVARLWSLVERPGPIDNIIALAAMMMSSVAFGWILHRYVELPIRQLTRNAKPQFMAAITAAAPGNSKAVETAAQ